MGIGVSFLQGPCADEQSPHWLSLREIASPTLKGRRYPAAKSIPSVKEGMSVEKKVGGEHPRLLLRAGRPYSSLGYKTPAAYAGTLNAPKGVTFDLRPQNWIVFG
jgi:hypothetical protein